MRYSFIIAGLFFLFEPCISFIDPLPDFIGAFLIMAGLSRACHALPSFDDSRNAFRKYGIASVICTVAIIPMMSVCSTDEAMHMVFSLAVGGVMLYFSLTAFSPFFDGVSYMNESMGTAIKTGGAKAAVNILFISKYFLALLPNLSYLWIESDNGIYETGYYPLAAYKTGITVITFVISLIISIPCLIVISGFFRKLKTNDVFNSEIYRLVSEYTPDVNDVSKKSIGGFLTSVIFAAWLVTPLELDSMPVIPYFISGAAVLIGLIYLKNLGYKVKKNIVSVSVFTAVSFAAYIAVTLYADAHPLFAYGADFFVTAAIYLAYIVSALVMSLPLLGIFRKICREHCGKMWESAMMKHNKDVANERKKLDSYCIVCYGLLTLSAICGGITFFMQRSNYELRLIHIALYAVFAVMLTVTISKIKTAVADKYS